MRKRRGISLLLAMVMTLSAGVIHVYADDTPTLNVTSNILGLADTGNKSTLKETLVKESGPGDTNLYYYDESGNRVIYENQLEPGFSVKGDTLTYQGESILSLENVDNYSLINSSKAVVKLIDGNGYYADEFVLSEHAQTQLQNSTWKDGKCSYTLNEGDLEWNNWDYYEGMNSEDIDTNSGREWSMMGGDGNGVYHFNFEVSGITYDNQEIAPAKIPVDVYIYGRSSSDLGLGTEFVENQVDENYSANEKNEEWIWETANQDAIKDGKPYMNDTYTDYFTVAWPEGTNASAIKAENVTITLRSQFGDEYVLSPETAYGEKEYAVIACENETVIAVTYQQWAYVPVYSQMTIEIDDGNELKASKDYNISSVTAYMVQTGGGTTVDHTVTCYNYYGVDGVNANNFYTLTTKVDGKTYFYAEDSESKGYLVEGIVSGKGFAQTITAPQEAWRSKNAIDWHVEVHNNVVFVETRTTIPTTVTKEINGEKVELTINTNFNKSIAQMLADGAKLQPGYNLNGSSPDKWAWSFRYQSGWVLASDKPTSLPYLETYPFGFKSTDEAVLGASGNLVKNPAYINEKVSLGPSGPGGMDKPGEGSEDSNVSEKPGDSANSDQSIPSKK